MKRLDDLITELADKGQFLHLSITSRWKGKESWFLAMVSTVKGGKYVMAEDRDPVAAAMRALQGRKSDAAEVLEALRVESLRLEQGDEDDNSTRVQPNV
jgi:hypothetical protein